ncbi:acyl carrier protein [Catenulispora sp. MAP5-51]|uniref:acyl carrier protein n=1 Tax=Catenulispora sp. MAP5-51 TaxID=3156298 RepID=UPI00351862AB
MNDVNDLIALLRDELGLPVAAEDAQRRLDQVPGWDSVHVLWLITVLERGAGHQVSLPDLLEANSIQEIYDLAVA